MSELAASFCEYAVQKIAQNFRQIERCAELLTTEELWRRSNEHCNAVGNLVLHLAGNIRQWMVGGLGGSSTPRDRAAEFAERRLRAAGEIMPLLQAAVTDASVVIASRSAAQLAATYLIQDKYRVTGIVAVTHVVEHFSFHTGQIVHITKAIRDVDLSLYDARGHKLVGGNVVP